MAMKAETVFKGRVREGLKTLAHTWFVKVQQVAINGTPDFLLCVNGHFVALELKGTDKDKTTKLQDYNLDKIREARGYAFIVHPGNWKETFKILQLLTRGYNEGKSKGSTKSSGPNKITTENI